MMPIKRLYVPLGTHASKIQFINYKVYFFHYTGGFILFYFKNNISWTVMQSF